ncbi:MAG: hypothetical protein AB8G96_05375 [Phycisphaerales bacterium]
MNPTDPTVSAPSSPDGVRGPATIAAARRQAALLTGIGLVVAGGAAVTAGAMSGGAAWAIAAYAAGGVIAVAGILVFARLGAAAMLLLAAIAGAAGLIVAGWVAAQPMIAVAGVSLLVVSCIAAYVTEMLRPLVERVTADPDVGGASGAGAAGGRGAAASPEVLDILRRIDEHAMLSDNARRVLFRERELQLLGRAIEDDIRTARYDVALTLCDELADVFGERERAEAYREQIQGDRKQHYDAALDAELGELERLLSHRQWQAAHGVAGRIRRLYADSHLVEDIDRRFVEARDEHKVELETQLTEAVQREDTEQAMQLLRTLDRYLTTDEVGRYSQLAGGVIKQHRENLSTQFKLAVNDHRWTESVGIGETIIAEFPNTKMAAEVRSMIDLLRSRAAGGTPGSGAAGVPLAAADPVATPEAGPASGGGPSTPPAG